ncbi:hypothetical protein QQS21_011223 [Conoideocrella luteorostrata]|uniref:Heterokaryon incompatibility domain-containing protein n=1 Tax=Conoideocrella luteorostrata TaxID=1105319 RepID=A0AAJ0FW34_9HYPO|nr:hypothetical protein QQS21_011223 [Conoideocrella luteorostrata]
MEACSLQTSVPSDPPSIYKYPPLPNIRSIRILTLQPSTSQSDPLIGSLAIKSLDSFLNNEATSSYETISYVWGTGGRTESLLCDGQPLPLTRSIYDALCQMRLPSQPRRLWADQICINQNDIQERSSQVRLMNEVYKGAVRVLVWLGRDDHGMGNDAVRMVDHLHGVFGDDDAHKKFKIAHSEQLYRQNQEPWVPFARLTRLPWFGRIWIVQEIGTGVPASLFWGSAELDWEKLSHVAGVLNQQYHFLRMRFHISTPSIRYLYNRFVEPKETYDENHNRGSFVYELHRARHLLARDPRDHVYAFLGHFSIQKGSWALQDLNADYSRPLAEVYIDVAIRILRGATSLILLSATHNVVSDQRKPPLGEFPLELPSWVPDWRVLPVHMIGAPVTPHDAARGSAPQLTIDEDNLVLHIRGVKIDVIRRRSSVFFGKAFQFRQARWRVSPVEALWRDVCGYTLFSLDEKYTPFINTTAGGSSRNTLPAYESSAFFALVQTLSNACVGGDRSRAYQDIPSKEWLANGASYLAKSGVARENISPQLLEHARTGDPFKWSHEATLVTRYRRFGVTEGGYFLIGPDSMEDGDVVAVLDGGRTPFVLRRSDDGDRDGKGSTGEMGVDSHSGDIKQGTVDDGTPNSNSRAGNEKWKLVGECYVHGLMNGEAHSLAGIRPQEFSVY